MPRFTSWVSTVQPGFSAASSKKCRRSAQLPSLTMTMWAKPASISPSTTFSNFLSGSSDGSTMAVLVRQSEKTAISFSETSLNGNL